LVRENAKTVIANSGEIKTMFIPIGMETWVDADWMEERLEVNT
jgi:hypothetical protein